MKTFARLVAGLCICAIVSQANAWSQPTHENIIKDTLVFVNSSCTTEEARQTYRFYMSTAGSKAQVGKTLGQATFGVDDFKDTRLGGWWIGYEHVPLWGAALGIVNYTSCQHSLNLARDGDSHGNPRGGYDYRYHKVDGGIADVGWYAMVYLYNRKLKRGDFDTTETHYRQDTRPDQQKHYGDLQAAAFQPIGNLTTYWFEQFRAASSLQTIGYALHATGDVTQPHHVWITLASGHSSWEGWADDHYASEKLNDPAAVTSLVGRYDPNRSIRDLLTRTSQVVHARPEPLYDASYEMRLRMTKELIPGSVALTITVLTKGANSFDVRTTL